MIGIWIKGFGIMLFLNDISFVGYMYLVIWLCICSKVILLLYIIFMIIVEFVIKVSFI